MTYFKCICFSKLFLNYIYSIYICLLFLLFLFFLIIFFIFQIQLMQIRPTRCLKLWLRVSTLIWTVHGTPQVPNHWAADQSRAMVHGSPKTGSYCNKMLFKIEVFAAAKGAKFPERKQIQLHLQWFKYLYCCQNSTLSSFMACFCVYFSSISSGAFDITTHRGQHHSDPG